MAAFVPPASSAAVAPPSPVAGVTIGSRDQVDPTSALVLVGAQILGGSAFTDTQGGFYPFVVSPAKSLVINGSDGNLFGIRFHNTAAVVTDGVIYMSNGGVIFVVPNTATPIGNLALFAVADRAASGYFGFVLYPGYSGGPRIYFTVDGSTFTPAYVGGANYIYISGTAAGFSPGITVDGVGTNLNLVLTPKGTGVVYFNYAVNALGGGAAPTLGTIGGTGPTAAAQNAWLKVNVNNTVYWMPLWV